MFLPRYILQNGFFATSSDKANSRVFNLPKLPRESCLAADIILLGAGVLLEAVVFSLAVLEGVEAAEPTEVAEAAGFSLEETASFVEAGLALPSSAGTLIFNLS